MSEAVLTDHSRFQVHEDCSWDVLPGAGLAKEGSEGVVVASGGLVGGHVAVRLDAVLQAVQLPARVSHLDPGLAHVDGDAFALRDTQQSSNPSLYTALLFFLAFQSNPTCLNLWRLSVHKSVGGICTDLPARRVPVK